jgi:hypothetical protein
MPQTKRFVLRKKRHDLNLNEETTGDWNLELVQRNNNENGLLCELKSWVTKLDWSNTFMKHLF